MRMKLEIILIVLLCISQFLLPFLNEHNLLSEQFFIPIKHTLRYFLVFIIGMLSYKKFFSKSK